MVISSPTVYVEQIVVNGITLERTEAQGSLETATVVDEDGLTSYRFHWVNGKYSSDNANENPNTVIIDYSVLPAEANHQEMDIVIAEEDAVNVLIFPEENKIVFLKRTTVKITLQSKDGSLVKTAFRISARR